MCLISSIHTATIEIRIQYGLEFGKVYTTLENVEIGKRKICSRLQVQDFISMREEKMEVFVNS